MIFSVPFRFLGLLSALALSACSGAKVTPATAEAAVVTASNIADDAWLLAAHACAALADSGVDVTGCAKALIPVQGILVKIGNDEATGAATLCDLAPVVDGLVSALAIKGVGSPALLTSIDALASATALCPGALLYVATDAGVRDAGHE